MKVSVCIKNAVDGCVDLKLARIEMNVIPQINTIISIAETGTIIKEYLVREIKQHYNLPQTENDKREFITVYVIPY